jgi:hypothetical protein
VARIFGFELFSNGKRCELGPWPMDHGSSQFTVDQGYGHGTELAGALAPSPFRQRGPDVSWGKEGATRVLPITEAWEAVRRQCTGGGVLAQKVPACAQ